MERRFRLGRWGPSAKASKTGTNRVCAAEGTLNRVGGVLKAIGVTRIANITGLDRIGIPVVMVCRPNARSLAVAQGKGVSLAAAKVGGVMEAIERYHAEHILLPLKFATYEELRYTHAVVEPASLHASAFFHQYRQIPWVEGRDLMSDQPFWVPYELIHTNFTLPFPTGSGAFTMSSSGVAAGNHMLEAVSHGVCEVVERHSTALWRRLDPGAQERTRLDLNTVDAAACRALLDLYEQADVAVAVWDTTTIGIASFLCTIADRRDIVPGRSPACSGMGCHPSRETALLRALTEAAQSRLTLIAGSRDDISRSHYDMACNPDVLRSIREGSEEHRSTRSLQEVPSYDSGCVQEDVEWELDCLDAAGFPNVIFVDLRRPELRIPVVRIVIPGCERDFVRGDSVLGLSDAGPPGW
jgi:YcaO-like protein with predicted kinase domain